MCSLVTISRLTKLNYEPRVPSTFPVMLLLPFDRSLHAFAFSNGKNSVSISTDYFPYLKSLSRRDFARNEVRPVMLCIFDYHTRISTFTALYVHHVLLSSIRALENSIKHDFIISPGTAVPLPTRCFLLFKGSDRYGRLKKIDLRIIFVSANIFRVIVTWQKLRRCKFRFEKYLRSLTLLSDRETPWRVYCILFILISRYLLTLSTA